MGKAREDSALCLLPQEEELGFGKNKYIYIIIIYTAKGEEEEAFLPIPPLCRGQLLQPQAVTAGRACGLQADGVGTPVPGKSSVTKHLSQKLTSIKQGALNICI